MPHRLPEAARVAVGSKQTLKAIQTGKATLVYLAGDADAKVIAPLAKACEERRIPVVEIESMSQLGRLCRIEVGAAAAAILQ